MSKTLRVLQDRMHDCQKCEIHEYRGDAQPILGKGSLDATYLFISDNPSLVDMSTPNEAPFSSRNNEGVRYMTFIAEAGFTEENSFFTSLIGCPAATLIPETDDTPFDLMERSPSKEEVAKCSSRLEELIYIIDPQVILLCGETAFSLVPPKKRGVKNTYAKAIGHLFEVVVPGKFGPVVYPAMPIPSPSQADKSGTAQHEPMAVMYRLLSAIRLYAEVCSAKKG